MQIEISEAGFDDPIVRTGQKGIELVSRNGEGRFRCYQGKGFSFWHNRYQFSAPTHLAARADLAVLELHITREGIWQGSWDGIASLDLHPGQFNLSYTPFVKTRALFRGGTAYRSCDIHFELSYLQELSPDFPALDRFLSAVTRSQPGSLSPRHHYCSKEMMSAVEAILKNPFGPTVQPYILELKVREILIAALEKVAADLDKPMVTLTGRQREALSFAKFQIESCADEPLTLPALARLSGINECTLKKGFRLLFGVSPYEYFVQLKMKKAMQLLLETDEPVTMIAYQLGYSQASSFGHEFRKATGVSPGLYRKMGGRG